MRDERLPKVLRAIADLEGHRLDELAVEEVLGCSVHALFADERVPFQILLAEDALHMALGVSELQGDIAEA